MLLICEYFSPSPWMYFPVSAQTKPFPDHRETGIKFPLGIEAINDSFTGQNYDECLNDKTIEPLKSLLVVIARTSYLPLLNYIPNTQNKKRVI